MTRAITTAFHSNPFNHSPMYRILWEYFKKELILWQGTFDKLYLVDSGFGFTAEDRRFLDGLDFKYQIDIVPAWSAAENLDFIYPLIQEDSVLTIHSDTIIYDPKIITQGFKDLEKFDTVTIFDGSGKSLKDKFPIMKANKYRSDRCRFCNYLWFNKMNIFRDMAPLQFCPTDDYPEACSLVTEQMLEKDVKVKELRDDRSNITMQIKPFKTFKTQWLDSGDKLWGQGAPLNLGYYHVRNFSGGISMVNDFINVNHSYQHQKNIFPLTELMRLFAWNKALADNTHQDFPVLPTILDLGVVEDEWNKYYDEFKEFHFFIDKI